MSQSLATNWIHLIYSTKNREPYLRDDVREKLWAYKAGILKQWSSPSRIIGGMTDHVHVLFQLSKNYSLAKVVEEVKKGASKWIKTQGPAYRGFQWQGGYAAFSVSESNLDRVAAYIANQERHHRGKSFQEELRAFLERHRMKFDERYLWD